jgi:hypothetical protein
MTDAEIAECEENIELSNKEIERRLLDCSQLSSLELERAGDLDDWVAAIGGGEMTFDAAIQNIKEYARLGLEEE